MDQLLSMKHLSEPEILSLIHRAIEMKKGDYTKLSGELSIANLFFENSTRTKTSFEMAEFKLGIHSIPFDVSKSSVLKGESLYDTCKTMEALGCDALVIRHEDNEYYEDLKNINIPVINGGDGSGSHPTQCLLDLMTIYEKFNTFQGLKIVIAGDISHSRVAHSNAQALEKLGAEVYYSGPREWQDSHSESKYIDFDEAVKDCDVIMLLRVQHERHMVSKEFSKEGYNQEYGMNEKRVENMKDGAIIMHPAPVNRGVEIEDHLVECDKSVIFRQMENGVFMRMSILEEILKRDV
jgi:aspartate carbamoyltransferase catalytic subunit